MTNDRAGASPVEHPVGRLVPERVMAAGQLLHEMGMDTLTALQQLQSIHAALGCEGRDSNTNPVDVIHMLRSWEVDASMRADLLAQHLRNVLEIARTWQPDYATKMDRDTLDLAAAEVGHKTPNAKLNGP